MVIALTAMTAGSWYHLPDRITGIPAGGDAPSILLYYFPVAPLPSYPLTPRTSPLLRCPLLLILASPSPSPPAALHVPSSVFLSPLSSLPRRPAPPSTYTPPPPSPAVRRGASPPLPSHAGLRHGESGAEPPIPRGVVARRGQLGSGAAWGAEQQRGGERASDAELGGGVDPRQARLQRSVGRWHGADPR